MAVKDTITGVKAKTYTVSGPASYATGGFLHDASADFSSIGFVKVNVSIRGPLPPCDYELLLNRDLSSVEAFGKAVIKVVRGRYDRATMGNPISLPAGTATQSALFAAGTTTGSSHTHTMNHDHPSTESGDYISGGGNANASVGQPPIASHTHTVDIANFTGSTTATTHSHVRAFEYDHSHTKTVANVDLSVVELANGANISTTTFKVTVFGFGKQ